ncbi:addiction module protein [uncultured Chryseobacterium sp.]|uniref:addiction module protein n=1 Tax=uncultured Chryseobacterium sp. TaxID=259322 RepID=UPI0025F3FB64|nr:addiction module protein [uncultured Chryseobacterium sp.]
MESTLEIRKRIHEFIDTADDRILRIFNGIIDAEEQEEDQPSVPEWFYEELDKRKEKYISGESKSFTWEEVKAKAKASLK